MPQPITQLPSAGPKPTSQQSASQQSGNFAELLHAPANDHGTALPSTKGAAPTSSRPSDHRTARPAPPPQLPSPASGSAPEHGRITSSVTQQGAAHPKPKSRLPSAQPDHAQHTACATLTAQLYPEISPSLASDTGRNPIQGPVSESADGDNPTESALDAADGKRPPSHRGSERLAGPSHIKPETLSNVGKLSHFVTDVVEEPAASSNVPEKRIDTDALSDRSAASTTIGKLTAAESPEAPSDTSQPASSQPAAQIGAAAATLAQLSANKKEVTIRLHPDELGHVQVRISLAPEGTTQVSVSVQRSSTLHSLQADLGHLHQALDRAGISTQRDVVLQLGQFGSPANDFNGQADGRETPDRTRPANLDTTRSNPSPTQTPDAAAERAQSVAIGINLVA